MSCKPQLVAIVGGSGSGKSWLADQLRCRLGKETGLFSLDSFYLDRSHLSCEQRETVNFDHPNSIDWPLVEKTFKQCLRGVDFQVPIYDFAQHCRASEWQLCKTRPVFLVDGLWLLRRARVRCCFAFSIFIDCDPNTRLERRLRRDVIERGRTESSIREQFFATVCPMHDRFVTPQRDAADLVISQALGSVQVDHLADHIRTLLKLKQGL